MTDVLMLTNAVTPDKTGGLERYVRELSAALVQKDVRVTVLTKRVDPSLPVRETGPDGVRLIRYPVPPLSDPLFVPRRVLGSFTWARREAGRRPAQILHAHFPVPALPLALGRRPFLYTLHAPVHKEVRSERQGRYALPRPIEGAAIGGLKAAERLIVHRASEVVVLSDFMRREVAELSGRAASRTLTVAGGIDTGRFRPGAVVDDSWATGDGPLLFTARRLTPRTGVAELIRAMGPLRARIPGVRLAIAGEGRMEADIRALVSGLPERDRPAVRLLGRVSEEDLVGWYRAADLVVMPTQDLEGFGLTSAEAMACGTPVVATPVGANPEVVGGLDPCLISADAAPSGIADCVASLLMDPDRLSEIRGRARDYALRFGWDAVASRHLALYARQNEAPR